MCILNQIAMETQSVLTTQYSTLLKLSRAQGRYCIILLSEKVSSLICLLPHVPRSRTRVEYFISHFFTLGVKLQPFILLNLWRKWQAGTLELLIEMTATSVCSFSQSTLSFWACDWYTPNWFKRLNIPQYGTSARGSTWYLIYFHPALSISVFLVYLKSVCHTWCLMLVAYACSIQFV